MITTHPLKRLRRFAEPYREPEPEPDLGKSGGLFGRLRGR